MFTRATALTPSDLESAIVRNPLIVTPDTTVMNAIAHMSGVRTLCETTKPADSQLDVHLEARSSCVLVVENGQLLGIFTERDVVRLSAQQRSLENLVIQSVMTAAVVTLHTADFTDLFFAINLLQQYHIRHLPILDEQDRLVGLVTNESLRQTARLVDLLRLRLVSEVMTSEVICAPPDSTMLAIAQRMAAHRVSSVVIVQPGDSQTTSYLVPVGIVTERDIVQFQALSLNLETCLAQAVMSTPIFAVKSDASLWVVHQTMEQRLIRRLAVTGEQGQLLGIVTQTSLLQALNPLELYKLAETLEEKVVRLEAEKVALLENRTAELERQVATRTIALTTQAEREQLVAAIAMQIRSSLSLQTILDTAVVQVRQVLGCDRVNIWQLDADWQAIVVAESTTSTLSLMGEQINDTCFKQEAAEMYRRGRIRVVPDIHTTAMSDCHRNMLIRLQTRAKLLVPLLCGDALWGLLIATESQHARDWQTEEVELLQTLAVQLAIALQQATTHQKLQEELSARRQTEARLRESEQRYMTLTAAAPVGIFRTDASGNSLYINQWCCEMLGLPAEATTGNGWQQALHPDDRELVIAETRRTRQENRPFQLEYRILRPDGTVLWVLGRVVAEHNADGQIIGYVGTITDISEQQAALRERKQAEAALIQSEAQSRAVLAAIPDLMFRAGADGRYRGFVTPKRDIDLLPTAFDSTGLVMKDVLPPAIANRQLHYMEQALRTGKLQVYEQQVLIGEHLQEEEVRVVKSGDDEVLFMIRDISDRKRSEEALKRSEAHQRALISALPDLIMRINRAGIYLEFFTSPSFHVVGDLPEMVGTHVSDSLPPDLAQRRMEFIQLALQTKSTQVYEQDLSIDGRTQIEEVRVVPYEENEVLLLVRDTSEQQIALRDRQQAEQQLYQLNQDLEAKVEARTAALQEREAELQKLSKRLSLSLNSAAIGCWEWDISRNIMLWDERMYELYGITEHPDFRVLYDVWANRLHPDDRIAAEALGQQAALGQAEYDTEFRVVHPDGSIHFIKAYGVLVRDDQGKTQSIIGVNFDLSDRKQAEQTIRQQAEREKLLKEITQRIRQSLDLQTIFDTACQEIRPVIQADRVSIFKFYPESNFDDGEFVAEAVLEGFPSIVAIQVHDHCFGEKYSPLYVQGRYAAMEDIYQLEECHTNALALFQVRANLVMPLICGEALWGLLCIHQCATTRQWQQAEIDFTQQIANQLAIAIQQSSLVEQLQTELAERHRAEARLTETNAQLATSNQELARATRLKDEFLANMSHELRTPLNAILGMSEGLQEEVFGTINSRQRKAIATVERSGQHLLSLINDILEVSKIEAGKLALDITTVSIAYLCTSSLVFVKQQALKKQIQLTMILPPTDLGDIVVDERRVRQALINLLTNAVKFTPVGGRVTLKVYLETMEVNLAERVSLNRPTVPWLVLDEPQGDCCQLQDSDLCISVADTGIGIATADQPKLFQPFIQLDSSLNRHYGGTGLGLTLVKQIVELHSGSVSLQSELGQGSCFTMRLPYMSSWSHRRPSIKQTQLNPDVSASDSFSIEPPAAIAACPIILLAEDNEANISTISSYLTAKNYQMLLAHNGQEAIALTKAYQPDLILMDIQMPGMDGLETMRQIRLDPNLADIPIVALTALAMRGDREQCLEAGANDYLAKPVKLKQLAATIQQLLDASNH